MDFDEILNRSLSTVNDGYATAFDDLTTIVDKVRAAALARTSSRVAIELKKVVNDIKGTVLRFYIDPDINDPMQELLTVTFFQIPAIGYPVKYGSYIKNTENFIEDGLLESFDELKEYFTNLLAQPESTLVQALGYSLRKHNS